MFTFPAEILPKSAAFGGVLWASFSFFVLGPEVAARVAQVDHLPVCSANYTRLVRVAAEEELQSLPAPDAEAGMALDSVEILMDNPLMGELGKLGGFGDMISGSVRQAREQQRAAQEKYERAKAEIEANTRRKLGNSNGFCGCVADAAIDKSRTDWALFAGSLGVFSSSKVENFGEAMTNPENVGACMGTAKPTENS